MFLLWFQRIKSGKAWSGDFIIQFLPALVLASMFSIVSAATLELKETAPVAHGTITLADVAAVTGTNTNSSTLTGMVIGASPLPGTSTPWTREAIAQIITSKFPQEKVTWQGALVCRVERPGRILLVEEVQARLEQELGKITRGSGEVSIKEINTWSDITVPQGTLDFAFELAPATLRSAWGGANMRITLDGEPVLARSVRFRWSWMRPGWQARTNLAAGQTVDLKDFEAVNVDVLTQPVPVFIGDQLPEDSSLTRGCVAGRLLTVTDFKPQTLVHRGTPVVLRYQKGALTIQLQATALQDGARGQVIAVQNNTTRKKIMARVTDESTLDYVQ